jgi:hypothetical protein
MAEIIGEVVEFVPRAVGWIVLKLVTFGRYRGFRTDDLLVEGGVGLATIAALCAAFYAW